MKKVIFASALLLAVGGCESGTSTKQPETTTSAGTGTTMPDTSVTPNQSGATGNGGVGTGATNGTGEESSATPKTGQK